MNISRLVEPSVLDVIVYERIWPKLMISYWFRKPCTVCKGKGYFIQRGIATAEQRKMCCFMCGYDEHGVRRADNPWPIA